jgi:hypothetical protein
MSYLRLLPVAAVLLLVTVSGCGSARMIQSSPDGGVVAIPSNSNAWPYQYRDHADKLMAMKCPNGYDIVREEEVIVGVKTTTTTQTADSVTQAGYKDNPVPTAATTSVTTTTRPQKEYRITFRAHQAVPVPLAVVPATPVLAPVPAVPVAVVSPPAPVGLPPRPEPVVR